jgi:hypothetical protein
MKRGVAALISVAAIAATLIAAVTLIGQQLAVPTELRSAPPTPSWLVSPPTFSLAAPTFSLAAEDKRVKQGARAVLSLHARDANFPTLNREGNLRSAARTGGKAKGVYPRRFR